MRINRQMLLKVAQDTIEDRTRRTSGIMAAFLCGSLLGEDFLLGGTADIDLVFIYVQSPQVKREIVRLTDEVHLDIAHYTQKDFRQTRYLRLHPWMGPTIYSSLILFDPDHFMDFTQASVRGQFDRPDYVLKRARQLAEHARQIWMGFYTEMPESPGAVELGVYLRAVEHAVNAIAILSGPPLTERRLGRDFMVRAEAIGRPGLHAGLLGLLGATHLVPNDIAGWFPDWQSTLEALPADKTPPRLHSSRIPYYRKGFEQLLIGEHPGAALWPLLRTWTQAVQLLAPESPLVENWHAAMQKADLLGTGFETRVQALDKYLDLVEETLEHWGRSSGV